MSIATLPTPAAFMPPCPDWCVECRVPDPGVVDHYSRVWSGRDHLDGAEWQVQVTQRVTADRVGLACIDASLNGTFASLAAAGRALMAAEALKDRINAERVAARKAVA